jgi:hypothetical protein
LAKVRLAVGQPLLASRELGQLPVDLLFLGEHALFDLDDSRTMLDDFLFDLGPELDRLLTRGDLGLAPQGVGLAHGLLQHLLPLLTCGPEPRLPQGAYGHGTRETPDDEADQYSDCNEHARLLGRLSAALAAAPIRH